MTCTACSASAPEDAVFCPDCGTAFCEIKLLDPCSYIEDDGRAEVHIELSLRTDRTLRLNRVVDEDTGQTLHSFDSYLLRKGTTTVNPRLGPFPTVNPHDPYTNLRCEADTPSGYKIELPLPNVQLSVPPEVEILVDGVKIPDWDTGDGDSKELVLAPSDDYRVPIEIVLKNDALTEITKVSTEGQAVTPGEPDWWLESVRGTRVEPHLLQRTTCGEHRYLLRLPPDLSSTSEEGVEDQPRRLRLKLFLRGLAAPRVAAPTLVYLRVPELQVLVERPTLGGVAFVGLSPIEDNDFAPSRLVPDSEEHGLAPLPPARIHALESDQLVARTIDELREKEIVWNVPRGASREKRIAIDRKVFRNPGDLDRISYGVEVVLGGQELPVEGSINFVGQISAGSRNELIIQLPALDADATGRLTIAYAYPDEEREETYQIRVRTFDQGVFPTPIGIDFGTTNSCVALSLPKRRRDGSLQSPQTTPQETFLVPFGRLTSNTTPIGIVPSEVWLTEAGEIRAQSRSPSRVAFREFKISILKESIPSHTDPSQEASPYALSTEFIGHLMGLTRNFLEERGLKASSPSLLSCSLPTAFSRPQRDRILTAYSEALDGLDLASPDLSELDESIAAFVFQRRIELEAELQDFKSTPILVMIYDFGGGTTDVTVFLLAWSEAENRWTYVELASGGTPQLGGRDVTRKFAQHLFQDAPLSPDLLDWAETLKVSTSPNITAEERRQHFRKALREALGIPGDEDKASDKMAARIEDARREVATWLRSKVGEILDEVLSKVCTRLKTKLDLDEVPFLVFLAGNASRLDEFPELVEESLSRWMQAPNGDFQGTQLVLDRLVRIEPPKACVAQGAYFYEGATPDISRPYVEHCSYWLQLPADSQADAQKHRVEMWDGRHVVKVIPEGHQLPTETQLDPRSLGLQRADQGTFLARLHRKQGVAKEEVRLEKLNFADSGQQLTVTVNTDGSASLTMQE